MSIDEIVMVWSGAVVHWAFLRSDGSPSNYIHRAFSRETWRESGTGRRLKFCAGLALRPLIVVALAGYFTRRNGGAVKRLTGKGIARQLCEQVSLGLRMPILPPWYYIFELYDADRRKRAVQYLNRFETKKFTYPFLRRYSEQLSGSPLHTAEYLSDKAKFAVRCREFGLAAVPALLIAEKGRISAMDGGPPALPEVDLFFKPLRGNGGRGAELWKHEGGGRYRSAQGDVLIAPQLLERLRTLSRRESYVVRPRVVNCRHIADLSNGALTTVRVVTCRNESARCEVTNAVFRMAQAGAIVDNFHAGGIVSKVDIGSGRLGPAVEGGFMGSGTRWHERHPTTGAPIAGRQLPFWPEVMELARRAHESAFADHAIIGWDIALLEDGPSLVEGNKGPCLDLVQKPHGEPLGDSRLGELLAINLKRALEAAHPSEATA
jgi:hypothetical protein